MKLNGKKLLPLVLLATGFCIGLVVMYLYFQTRLVYQGRTAQAWAKQEKIESDNYARALKQVEACQNDPSSTECNPQWNFYNTEYVPGWNSSGQKPPEIAIDCENTATDAASVYWRYKNCPPPAPRVEYRAQHAEAPTQQDSSTEAFCYPDGSGGEWCKSSGGNTQHCMYYGNIRKCN